MPEFKPMRYLSNPRVAGGLLALLAVLVYLPIVANDFVFDDIPAIVQNPVVSGDAPWTEAFTQSFWGKRLGFEHVTTWRPLTTLGFWANAALFGLEPAAFHWINLLMHALVTVLVFVLIGRWFGQHDVACLGAGLFAVSGCETAATNGQ